MTTEGLFKFYASQADLVISQFENFGHLLGKTHDQSYPGSLCEILIRNAIRQVLPNRLAAQKGFVFGPNGENGKTHSPEIDIIIHDVFDTAPIYSIEDFVIVHPRSVKAVIQVKKSLTTAQLKRGLRNISEACDFSRRNGGFQNDRDGVFSAIIGVDGALFDAESGDVLPGVLQALSLPHVEEKRQNAQWLPDFIGTIAGGSLVQDRTWMYAVDYAAFQSEFGGRNVAFQRFLATLFQKVLPYAARPFAFPSAMTQQTIRIWRSDSI